MVFVKVRETYDLKTVQNKMTVIAIHTPKPDIIKKNYPGLLMQCRAYRPVSADVRVACASVLPLDPLGVGTEAGDVAPEDVFNPILYKAISNKGMSQLESRILQLSGSGTGDVIGQTADVEVDGFSNQIDEFPIYYGLLSETHAWKHAAIQSGFSMTGLKPYVYDVVANVGDAATSIDGMAAHFRDMEVDAKGGSVTTAKILGKAKEFPFINCLGYTGTNGGGDFTAQKPGFDTTTGIPYNESQDVPYIRVACGAVIIPPSRLHSLYFRMVVEWTIEFSSIRPLAEITDWAGLANLGTYTHYQNYSYSSAKEAITGSPDSILDEHDVCMVSSNVDVDKVM